MNDKPAAFTSKTGTVLATMRDLQHVADRSGRLVSLSGEACGDVVAEIERLYAALHRMAFATEGIETHWQNFALRAIRPDLPISDDSRCAFETSERVRLTGQCSACSRGWIVECEPRTDVMVSAFHCPCGHVTRM